MTAIVDSCPDLDDPLLAAYPPSERRAILVHRYFLGIEWNREPGLGETIASWESRAANDWRAHKMRADAQAQVSEINDYRERLSQEQGRDVRWEEAAAEWAAKHAAAWRNWWEGTPRSGA